MGPGTVVSTTTPTFERRLAARFADLAPAEQRVAEYLRNNLRDVIFASSADPLHKNPTGTCQLFSIGTAATGLRQLTRFSSPEHSVRGCLQTTPPGCRILPYGVEPATATLAFYSSCDPFGTNPSGDQLFAISANGTHLRQLTHARGLFTDANGTVSAENIGPIGHSPIAGQY